MLVRVTNGKHKDTKKKVSTIVELSDIDSFYSRYADVCKAGMVGMKKRDRSGRKKAKAKGKEKKGGVKN